MKQEVIKYRWSLHTQPISRQSLCKRLAVMLPRVKMIVSMRVSRRQTLLTRYKKQSKIKNSHFQMEIPSRCQLTLLLNLHSLPKQEWLLQIPTSKIKIIGSPSLIFVVSNFATFSQFVMAMDSGERKSRLT